MKSRLFRLLTFGIIAACSMATPKPLAKESTIDLLERVESSIVKIIANKQRVRPGDPWTQTPSYKTTTFGVAIKPPDVPIAILSTASSIRNNRNVYVKTYIDTKRRMVHVHKIDRERNLVLLTFPEHDGPAGLKPIPLATELRLGDGFSIIKRSGDKGLALVDSSLTGVELLATGISHFPTPQYRFHTPASLPAMAEPLLRDGKLAGLVTSSDDTGAAALPQSAIKNFVEHKLSGLGQLGINTQTLHSESYRKYLGDKGNDGVVISEIFDHSDFAKALQPGDILATVNNMQISSSGTVKHDSWGTVPFQAVLSTFPAGHRVQLITRRKNQVRQVAGKLVLADSSVATVPTFYEDHAVPFIIFGGLIIQELSVPFLQSFGRHWQHASTPQFLFLYKYHNDLVSTKRVIILNKVLADSINEGYHGLQHAVIRSVNDRPVHSMASVIEAFKRPIHIDQHAFGRLRFAGSDGEVIISYSKLQEAHSRISSTFQIPSRDFFSLNTQDHKAPPK